ncbi:hypothetical protein [Sorangium sp. So ce854]|uniref:hypothetical protein n=1 Tax=Sorangium sp. So ce854 TaxID=3133322 RepID=UPI003F5F8160
MIIEAVQRSSAPEFRQERSPTRIGTIPGTILTGVLLNQFRDVIAGLIREFESASKGILIQAGGEVFIAVQNAEVAYERMLTKTFDELDASVQGAMHGIAALIDRLEQQIAADASSIMSDAQTIITALPFASKMPIVASFGPRYVALSSADYPLTVDVKGNFLQAADPDFRPHIIVAERRIEPIEITTQQLKFQIPTHLLPARAAGAECFSSAELNLLVPYDLGAFHRKKIANFKLFLGVLPPSPGTIVLKKRKLTPRSQVKPVSSYSWRQHSSDDDLSEHYCADPPPAEWSVVPGSATFIIEWSQGRLNEDWFYNWERDRPSVCFKVTTIHRVLGTSGKVNFHFDYQIERTWDEVSWDEERVSLGWGDSRSYDLKPGEWKVVFDSFDGRHYEIAGSESTNSLVVRAAPLSVQIAAPPAAQVNWP